jgi:hypothetical protein
MEEKKTYAMPNPEKESDWYKCLILSFKTLKGFEYNDRGWDIGNFARCIRSAKGLIEICGSLRSADACMVELGAGFDNKGLEWTLETVCRHAPEWLKRKRGGVNGAAARKRFFSALAQRKPEKAVDELRKGSSAREMLAGIRNLSNVQPASGAHNGGSGDRNGHGVEKLHEEETSR